MSVAGQIFPREKVRLRDLANRLHVRSAEEFLSKKTINIAEHFWKRFNF